jgi:CheY-like chemotaxis protein
VKKVLFVEDDPLIARVYTQKLAAEGFDLSVAADGLMAIQRLRECRPDLVVLDLLMPKLSGVDVLRFIRQQPELKNTRIIVFSNSFLSDLIEQVAAIGVEEALVKASVTPPQLVEIINETLERPPRMFLTADAMAAHLAGHFSPAQNAVASESNDSSKFVSAESPAQKPQNASDQARIQKQFLDRAPTIFESARQICRDFIEADHSPSEPRKLEDLRRKIGFVSQTLGVTGRPQLASLAAALEAMLFELEDKLTELNDSQRHTIASTVAFMADQFELDQSGTGVNFSSAKILVVDDNAVTNRAIVLALGRASLSAVALADPFDALERLKENSFDLVLLDVNMPGLDGIGLCEQMRRMPLHKKTPVVFVTGQSDFKTRARTALSGGNDLIAKPILPNELCVKALTHLLKQNRGEPVLAH